MAKDSVNTTLSNELIKESYNNLFDQAKACLFKIVKIETENPAILSDSKKKKLEAPLFYEDDLVEEYVMTKLHYRELLQKLLERRSAFTKGMKIDMTSTIHTVQNVERFILDEDEVS